MQNIDKHTNNDSRHHDLKSNKIIKDDIHIKHYPDVKSNVQFPQIEEQILKYWQEHDIFNESIESKNPYKNGKNNEFVFYDGPPFANGLPHYGHLLTGFVKDCYARYQTTKGKKVDRKFGWDCHGLPAEMSAEKELGFSGRIAINEYGIDKFNDHCRDSVMKYSNDWEKYVTRQARWVDFENSYKTMDKDFMESTIWAFKELYKKGLIYQSMKVMPYSWACETPLSNFETRLDNSYRERADKAVTVSFTLNNKPKNAPNDCKSYQILAWTTTPWTLPANLALAVHPEMDYIYVVKNNLCYIIASFALAHYKKELNISEDQLNIAHYVIKGKDLVGNTYQPLFKYFSNNPNSFQILGADFVVEGDGTGIVHIAPGFGEDDQIICEKSNIALVCPVDNAGKFTNEVLDFAGMQVFEANDPIIIALKKAGQWIKTEQYLHNYPHCWRTDTPLIYKAVPSWYIKVTAFKDRMVELNQEINWIPHNIKDGLFGKWLENARDWAVSRNRFWGTPIPIWESDDPNYPRIDVYGSIEEIESAFNTKINDLHKPFIDNLTRPNPDDPTGKSIMRRVGDVFDCWFESGSMPYAQVHYPFENKIWFESHFPADFIVEYSAQTRGWFYTLMVLSTALFDKPPFLNCICHGVILDSTGQKLSKRLNNYADPLEMFDKYGADAMRATMLSSSVVKGQELLIDKEGQMIFDTLRLLIKPIWNSYHFFCLYANSDQIQAHITFKSKNLLDRYILSKLKLTIERIEKTLDLFDSIGAYAAISEFFEVLNNWYIRRSRNRFWKKEKDGDKIEAYNTLYTCLEHMSRAMSSLLPLISEYIYLGLTSKMHQTFSEKDSTNTKSTSNTKPVKMPSVHLTDFPQMDHLDTESALVHDMDKVIDLCSAALFIRNNENIRVRQPLASITIISKNNDLFKRFEHLIQDEINIKAILYNSHLLDYAEQKLSINFPALGKRLPHKMKTITQYARKNDWTYDGNVLLIDNIKLMANEYSIILKPKMNKGTKALSDNQVMVSLDLNLTPELQSEGIARDIIRLVQQARRDANLDVSDTIYLSLVSDIDLLDVLKLNQQFIESQTLSTIITNFESQYSIAVPLLNGKLDIKIAKI